MDWPDEDELAWTAALWIGEGSVCAVRGGPRLILSLSMLDHLAVERAALTFNQVLSQVRLETRFTQAVSVSYQNHVKGGTFARIGFGGEKAWHCLRALWPWMNGTLKGQQAQVAVAKAGFQALSRENSGFYPVQLLCKVAQQREE